jgi:hypothetical protein
MATSSSMSDVAPRRQPLSAWFGLLVGGVSGPLLAYALVLMPDSELLGPYPAYEEFVAFAGVTGALAGPPVGLGIALIFGLLQRWWWGELRRHPSQLDRPESDAAPQLPEGSSTPTSLSGAKDSTR